MKILQAIKDKIDRFGYYWSFLILAIVFFPTLESVFLRTLFNNPSIWTAELTTIIFGIFFFIGGAYCEARSSHVSMDLFYGNYKGVVKIVADTVIFIFCFIYCVLLIYFGGQLAIKVLMTGERSETLWAPYIWPSRWAIPIGAFLLLLRSFISYVEKIRESCQWIKEGKNK